MIADRLIYFGRSNRARSDSHAFARTARLELKQGQGATTQGAELWLPGRTHPSIIDRSTQKPCGGFRARCPNQKIKIRRQHMCSCSLKRKIGGGEKRPIMPAKRSNKNKTSNQIYRPISFFRSTSSFNEHFFVHLQASSPHYLHLRPANHHPGARRNVSSRRSGLTRRAPCRKGRASLAWTGREVKTNQSKRAPNGVRPMRRRVVACRWIEWRVKL